MRIPFRVYAKNVQRCTGATDIKPVRDPGTKRALNATCTYTDFVTRERVFRFYDTDVIRVAPDGGLIITFGRWHTLTTRDRFNLFADLLGLPLRACSAGPGNGSRIFFYSDPTRKGWVLEPGCGLHLQASDLGASNAA